MAVKKSGAQAHKVDLTTGRGTVSFPHLTVTQAAANKNDKGDPVYDVQFIIPKTQRDDLRKILSAIKEVGEAKWGDNWKKVRNPLRDGDKEAGDLTEDGSTKGAKYPERLGCFFINARSTKPVGVFDRQRRPLLGENDVYGGCIAQIAVTFYPYSNQGNHGIGVGLNGVQKVADGEPLGGGGAPKVESMFDLLDDDDDLGLDDEDEADEADEIEEDEIEEEPEPPKRKPAKKAAAKKAKPKPAPVEVDDEDEDLFEDDDDI